jgi:hypothetical protein
MDVSGQLHAPAALHLGNSPGTHWVGGWVGLRAGLEAAEKRKYLPIAIQLAARRYTDWAFPAWQKWAMQPYLSVKT